MGKLLSFTGLTHFLEQLRTEVSRKIFENKYSLFSGQAVVIKGEDGLTQGIVEENDLGVATTSFSTSADGVRTIVVVLEPATGKWNYTKTITVSSDTSGNTITESFTKTAK